MPPSLVCERPHPRLRDQTRLRSHSFCLALSLALRRRFLHAVLRQEEPPVDQLCLQAQSKAAGHHRLQKWRRERLVTCRESFLCSPSSAKGLPKPSNEHFQSFKHQRHRDAAREPETDRRWHPHAHVLSLRCNGWASVFCQRQLQTQICATHLHSWPWLEAQLVMPGLSPSRTRHSVNAADALKRFLCGPHELSTPTDCHSLTAGSVLLMPVPKKSQMAPILTSE